MPLTYVSVCSGIEAATVAFHPLGWRPLAFAESEPFPSAVLAHHYPHVPNLGDITKFKEWPDARFDALIGGTPCQAFSIAGFRQGFADARGNLTLTYCAILARYRPKWFLWENVPGVLSVDGGRAFGSFLGAVAELGYGFAYRVLDAQHVRVDGFGRAVPQRRRRVFVVGHLGDWRRPAAVLFEPESVSGHLAPRRQARQDVAGALGAGSARSGGRVGRREAAANHLIAFGGNDTSGPLDVATARNAHSGPHGRLDFESETFVAHALRADGFDASEDGTGRGTPLVPIAQCVADPITAVFYKHGGASAGKDSIPRNHIIQNWGVRRLTPTECERLQGFSDGYTAVRYRKKPAADGPRYKALGNSFAVNVVRWIGQRIEMVRTAVGDHA